MVFNNKFGIGALLSCIFLTCISNCSGAKILCIFPVASYSHQQPELALSHALAAKGHDMTVITANPSKVPIKNHRDIDLAHLYKLFRSDDMEKGTGFSTQKRSTGYEVMKFIDVMTDFLLNSTFNSPSIQNLIKEINGTKYDLIIYEVIMGTSLLGFADLIGNPPIIGVATTHLTPMTSSLVGNPTIPSYIPSLLFPVSDHMSFFERLNNLYFEFYSAFVMEWYLKPIQEKYMHQNFGNYHRKIHELESNHSLLIASADLATSYPKPVQPNTVHVGPMHLLKKLDPLPQDLKSWMDESEDGVIYFSLGSNMQGTSVPEHIRTTFIKAFKQFPKVRVLWKWESDAKLPGQPDNVLVKKWLPQQPILAHPKVRVFISQVGLQSFQEATHYGVPVLGVPMFGDQDFNAHKIVTAGMGLSVEFQSITYDLIYQKLKDLLTNQSYKENMLRQSSVSKDTVMSPVDTAVWWVEYVLRHNGAPHLRPAVLDLTWYQYYMLDILLVVVISISVILYIIYFFIKKVMQFLSSSSTKSSKKKKIN